MNSDEVNEAVSRAAEALSAVETPWIIVALLPDGSGRVVSENLKRWNEFSTCKRPARKDLNQLLDATIGKVDQ